MHCLIIDDDPMQMRILSRGFARASSWSCDGLEMTDDLLASWREGACELDAVSPPDLVLLDQRLHDGDAIDLVPALRRRLGPGPVLMVMSAIEEQAGHEAYLAAGADDRIVKPSGLQDIQTILAQAERVLQDRASLA